MSPIAATITLRLLSTGLPKKRSATSQKSSKTMYEEKEAILHAIEAVKSSIEIFGGEEKENPSK